MAKENFNYITEVIDEKAIEWMLDHKDGFTLVVAPTGTGKSTFIIEDIIKPNYENDNLAFGEGKYQEFAKKKILVMANRTAVVLKFHGDVERACDEMGIFKAEGVTVASYQKVTDKEMIQAIDEADIIICDEAHYFISDAWNGTTNIIIDKILVAVETKPVIFFTATPQLINKYFNHRGLVYKELDYRDVLGFNERMDFICTNKNLEQIIKEISPQDKWIAFAEDMKSKVRLKNWCKKLIDDGYNVEYYHSVWLEDNDGVFRGRKHVEMAQKLDMLVANKKFHTQGALANKAIDNGIDIKDLDLKHIILLNQFDHVQIQQMVGRKRFEVDNSNDRLTVWFTTESKPVLENTYQSLANQVKLMNEYSNHRFVNFNATKELLGHIPSSKNLPEEELIDLAENTVLDSFLKQNDNLERLEEMKLAKALMKSDEFAGLLRYQLGYIAPLVRKYLVDVEKEDGTFEITEKQNIVRNYQELVKDLFNRPSTIQWRNKDEVKDELTKLQEQRVVEELIPYIEKLEDVKLFGDLKRDFRAQISYYFGASKRSDKLLGLVKINEFLEPHGYLLKDRRETGNGKR